MLSTPSRSSTPGYRWSDLLAMVRDHRRELILANIIAVLGTLAAVPVPAVDAGAGRRGAARPTRHRGGHHERVFPAAWHGPVLYIVAAAGLDLAAPPDIRRPRRLADTASSP
jgi:ATP-binding cassette subfamily C protein